MLQKRKYPESFELFFVGGSTWKIVLMYTVPIMMFSAVFNVPKFFEFRVIEEKLVSHDAVTNTSTVLNETRVGFQPTNLRLDEDYVVSK